MTREHWQKMLPIIRAFANGETIQFQTPRGWEDIRSEDPAFDADPDIYRIKPKPREWESSVHDETGVLGGSETNILAKGWRQIRVREIIED